MAGDNHKKAGVTAARKAAQRAKAPPPAAPAPIAGGSGVLTIDLAALQHNYRLLTAQAHGAEVAGVVKADAYGLGAAEIAPALYDAGCRLFFVAQLAEAFALQAALAAHSKKNAPQKRGGAADKITIALLNDVLPQEAEAAAQAGFVPVLNSLESVRAWAALCRRHGRKLPAQLQLDSGMARLGLDSGEIAALARAPDLLAAMEIQALLSHLACGDDRQSPMNAAQKKRFLADVARLAQAARVKPRLSFAASGGAGLGAAYCMDIVRPGLALYGGAESGGKAAAGQAGFRPVVALSGRILRVGQLKKGETVGYGAAYKADKPKAIATVSVGYADGWLRSLSNRGAVYYHGARLPILGRISMDCMVVDLSALPPDKQPKRGDLAELIGKHQTLQKVAQDAGTIAYEILTSLGRRYQRIYLLNKA